jgi:hypothetical protein
MFQLDPSMGLKSQLKKSLPGGHGPLADAILQVVERIDNVLREERNLLSSFDFKNMDALTARKCHLALELGRLVEHADDAAKSDFVHRSVSRLKADLVENAKLLQRHIDATNEISSILRQVIEADTADGTYTNQLARVGPKSWSR